MMKESEFSKLIKAGYRVYRKDEAVLVIREYTAKGWRVRYRARDLQPGALGRLRRQFARMTSRRPSIIAV